MGKAKKFKKKKQLEHQTKKQHDLSKRTELPFDINDGDELVVVVVDVVIVDVADDDCGIIIINDGEGECGK